MNVTEQTVVWILLVEGKSFMFKRLCLRFKDSRSSTLDGDPYILHDNGTLEVRVAQSRHSGKYTCVAQNFLGNYENHIYLEVKGEYFFNEDPNVTEEFIQVANTKELKK